MHNINTWPVGIRQPLSTCCTLDMIIPARTPRLSSCLLWVPQGLGHVHQRLSINDTQLIFLDKKMNYASFVLEGIFGEILG